MPKTKNKNSFEDKDKDVLTPVSGFGESLVKDAKKSTEYETI